MPLSCFCPEIIDGRGRFEVKNRLLAVLCAIALLTGILAVSAPPVEAGSWDDDLMFIALNDILLSLDAENRPILVGRTVYVPYNLFDHNLNGRIGLSLYSGGQSTVGDTTLYTIYSSDKNLNFDLSTGISYSYYPDDPQQPRAVIRNGRIYLSAQSLCRYFHTDENRLTFSQMDTKFGYPLIRISNINAQFTDSQCLAAAEKSALQNVLNNYLRSLNLPIITQSPDPTPTPTPTPTPSREPNDHRGTRTHLALVCSSGKATGEALNYLRNAGETALILLPAQNLAQMDDLARRAIAEGHTLGLLTQAPDAETALAELDHANQLLRHIAYTETAVAYWEGGDNSVLRAAGWLTWQGTLSARPDGRSAATTHANLVSALEKQNRQAYITCDDTTAGARTLSLLLGTLRQDNYNTRPTTEADLSA